MPAGPPGTKHATVDVTTLDYEAVPGATIAAVVVHPHPDMGGDRFNHVVDAIYRALPPAGLSVARFDLSSSDPEQAHADTLLAIDMVGAPRVAIVGYSFGADVALGLADTGSRAGSRSLRPCGSATSRPSPPIPDRRS